MTMNISRGEARLLRDLSLASGTESVEELAVMLERHDEIFTELIRLRRALVRTPFWQLRRRRSLENRIAALKAEQERL